MKELTGGTSAPSWVQIPAPATLIRYIAGWNEEFEDTTKYDRFDQVQEEVASFLETVYSFEDQVYEGDYGWRDLEGELEIDFKVEEGRSGSIEDFLKMEPEGFLEDLTISYRGGQKLWMNYQPQASSNSSLLGSDFVLRFNGSIQDAEFVEENFGVELEPRGVARLLYPVKRSL